MTSNHDRTHIATGTDRRPSDTTHPAGRGWRTRRWLALGGPALLLASAGLAAAAISNVVGMAAQVAPPATVLPAANQGAVIQAFNELQNVILPVDLPVDARGTNPPTELRNEQDLRPGKIPAGTCVSSHYLHFDPAAAAAVTGGVAFDGPILGVAVMPDTLDATNPLGWPWTSYPADANAGSCAVGANHCGLELTGQDLLRVGIDRVELSAFAANPGDRIRVITAGDCRCNNPGKP